MAGTTRWIVSLERGKMVVAMCCIVISALSVTCAKLYFSNEDKKERLNTLIYKNETECSKRVQVVEHEFRAYQDKKDKEVQDFMKEQLAKAQNLRDNAMSTKFKYYQMQKEAIHNNVKVKSLIKDEKK